MLVKETEPDDETKRNRTGERDGREKERKPVIHRMDCLSSDMVNHRARYRMVGAYGCDGRLIRDDGVYTRATMGWEHLPPWDGKTFPLGTYPSIGWEHLPAGNTSFHGLGTLTRWEHLPPLA